MSIRHFYWLPAHAISFLLVLPHNTDDNFFSPLGVFLTSIPAECVIPALVQLVSLSPSIPLVIIPVPSRAPPATPLSSLC